ncbi:camp phosphodiesterase class-ii like protein [Zymoseptoria brevis]|uniref:Camp phosphodiesterase class-ii like protein n=1 Tax=Zymoseptoria brevis TaxID=1047168 RepID=A0A0F4G9J6_9PEZI|nr:camp phosphodiesterase class-ii like protein [Zymoseptoria brevis]
MKDSGDEDTSSNIGLHGQPAALQVICLGSGGGPSEDNVTGFLVRSVGSNWAKGSMLAVDAGSHLAPITRMLERHFPAVSRERSRTDSEDSRTSNGAGSKDSDRRPLSPSTDQDSPPKPRSTILGSGPFAGLKFPNESARANALHVLRTYISTYLITHPHLDHLSGFAINTAAFHATSRPKTLAALPSTVDAIKTHIFNDVIWPNLTDEDGGVGFVTFQRLKEGGDVMVGEGEGRGYIEVCDGLAVRAFKVSHGCCTKSPPSHQHRGSMTTFADSQSSYNGSVQVSHDLASSMVRTSSMSYMLSAPGTPGHGQRQSSHAVQPSPPEGVCVVDSTAYFLRDEDTQREVLIFGDVEPDSLSLSPRTYLVWQEAARKVAHDILGGIFIECSYDDSQADAILFGHLNPKHLIAELQNLASMVIEARNARQAEHNAKKRKRSGQNSLDDFVRYSNTSSGTARKRSRSSAPQAVIYGDRRRSSAPNPNHSIAVNTPSPTSPHSSGGHYEHHSGGGASHSSDMLSPRSSMHNPPSNSHGTTSAPSLQHEQSVCSVSSTTVPLNDDVANTVPPLNGIKIFIIHIKDTLKDGPHVSERILAELQEHEARLQEMGQGLGCEFVIPQSGESYWF